MGPNENKELLCCVYEALREKGYHPLGQIVGYLLTEDPTYITKHNGARQLIRMIRCCGIWWRTIWNRKRKESA